MCEITWEKNNLLRDVLKVKKRIPIWPSQILDLAEFLFRLPCIHSLEGKNWTDHFEAVFSYSRGEVCVIEPLHMNLTIKDHPMHDVSILAMASLSKVRFNFRYISSLISEGGSIWSNYCTLCITERPEQTECGLWSSSTPVCHSPDHFTHIHR